MVSSSTGSPSREEPGGPADPDYLPATVERSTKILVVGSFGVGKTTLIGSVSEISPLRTEEVMTADSRGIDDLAGLPGKTKTTVAMDFGRITLSESTVLYLFGMPGQSRFWPLWHGLSEGAVGALVLVDTRRLKASFEVIDMLEEQAAELPLAVAVNHFPDSPRHDPADVREALDLRPQTPVLNCDARDRGSSMAALAGLTRHALAVDTYALAAGERGTL